MWKIVDEKLTMEDLLGMGDAYVKPELGTVVKGKVLSMKKNHIIVDLNGVAVGIIAGAETHDSAGTIRNLAAGDEVQAVVVEDENESGMVVLSLRKASQANAWDRFEKAFKDAEIVEVNVTEANKGGLLLDVDGIKGFIPVSQLAPVHYPRVDGADANQILLRLKKLVGQKFKCRVINVDRATGKMILSEKAAIEDAAKKAMGELKVGDVVDGSVSGVVKFGIFVTFGGLEGLVHISEIAWGHVSNPHQYAKVGDPVRVQIIGIDKDKLSLSIKRLMKDPWEEIASKYPIGSSVKGTVNRFSQFGAFVQLEDDINGLIHLSELSDKKVEDPKEVVSIGDVVEATVINIDRDEHRIGLSLRKHRKEPSSAEPSSAEASEVAASEAPEKEEALVAEEVAPAEEAAPDEEPAAEPSSTKAPEVAASEAPGKEKPKKAKASAGSTSAKKARKAKKEPSFAEQPSSAKSSSAKAPETPASEVAATGAPEAKEEEKAAE